MKKCFLFDFDGVIADTEESNANYLAIALKSFGIELTAQDRIDNVGRNGGSTITRLLERAERPVSIEDLSAERKRIGNTYENSLSLCAMPGLRQLIDCLRNSGCKLALVSSTSSRLILAALNRLGMTRLFDVIICGDMVNEQKPNSECYQKAMALLGESPENCVIIEDSPVGIEAALASGATVVAYKGCKTQQDTSAAHYQIYNYSEFDVSI